MNPVKYVRGLYAYGSRLHGFEAVVQGALVGDRVTVVLRTKSKLEADLLADRYREAGFKVSTPQNYPLLAFTPHYEVTVSFPEKA